MITVLVFGTFDVIHAGHKWFLKKAQKLGDRLVAVVSRDSFVLEQKGALPRENELSRINALKSAGIVDHAVLADAKIRTYGVIQDIKPDIICLGHDQQTLREDLEKWLEHEKNGGPSIHVLASWKRHKYSSSYRNRPLGGIGAEESLLRNNLLIFLLIIAMVIFGFSWVSGKRLSNVAPPAVLACIRFFLTFVGFLPTLIGRKLPQIAKGEAREGWLRTSFTALLISAYNLLCFTGLRSGLANKGGLIVTTMNPLIAFLLLLPLNRGRIGIGALTGIVMGIIGAVLLFEPWLYSFQEIVSSGNLAFLAAAAAWALLTLTSRKAQSIMGFRRFNIILYSLATLMMLPFAFSETAEGLLAAMNWIFWADMMFISVVVGAFGTGVYLFASSRLGAARGSSFTYLVPVSALFFTSILLNEQLQPLMLLGGSFAIGAVILINHPHQA